MKNYQSPRASNWKGRASGASLYLHEKVALADLQGLQGGGKSPTFALLGYACDEGVKRNQGRPGAAGGPKAIRGMLGRLPNHLGSDVQVCDLGDIVCMDGQMEAAQASLGEAVCQLLKKGVCPLVLGGGHDMAFGHYTGIREYLGSGKRIGIVNFDAHFDLRSNTKGNHSGTPFYQIGTESGGRGEAFDYLCLGVRKDANDATLYVTAESLGVHYIERDDFTIQELTSVQMGLLAFMDQVDVVYVTIDLDGFSSAFAPGVSAPSPMGFFPDIVWEALKIIVDSGKLCSLDIAELNPEFDQDHQTARLAASLLHAVMHRWSLL